MPAGPLSSGQLMAVLSLRGRLLPGAWPRCGLRALWLAGAGEWGVLRGDAHHRWILRDPQPYFEDKKGLSPAGGAGTGRDRLILAGEG